MRYLTIEQAEDILRDGLNTTEADFELVLDKIDDIENALEGYFLKKKITAKDGVVNDVIKKLKVLKEDVEKLNTMEDEILNEMESVAICNEIYNSLEVNRLMKKL